MSFSDRVLKSGLKVMPLLTMLKRMAIIDELATREIYDEGFFEDIGYQRADLRIAKGSGLISEEAFLDIQSTLSRLEQKAKVRETIADEVGYFEGRVEGEMWKAFAKELMPLRGKLLP